MGQIGLAILGSRTFTSGGPRIEAVLASGCAGQKSMQYFNMSNRVSGMNGTLRQYRTSSETVWTWRCHTLRSLLEKMSMRRVCSANWPSMGGLHGLYMHSKHTGTATRLASSFELRDVISVKGSIPQLQDCRRIHAIARCVTGSFWREELLSNICSQARTTRENKSSRNSRFRLCQVKVPRKLHYALMIQVKKSSLTMTLWKRLWMSCFSCLPLFRCRIVWRRLFGL